MPRIARLITLWTKSEIAQLLRSARSVYRSSRLDIKKAPLRASEAPVLGRLLIITPKKSGSAPQRNLVRRRIKALFYENEWYKQPFNWVLYIKSEIHGLSFKELKELLALHMRIPHE